MSFMFNPHPYDDWSAVNRPHLSDEEIDSVIAGTKESAKYISGLVLDKLEAGHDKIVLAIDGYIGATFKQIVNLVSQELKLKSFNINVFDFKNVLKSQEQLENEFSKYLEEDRGKDPVLLFGKLFNGSYEDLFDSEKLVRFEEDIRGFISSKSKGVYIISGFGCSVKKFRRHYDLLCYVDVTPKEVVLRAKKGMFANLGDEITKPYKSLMRRCYYVDFEIAGHQRWELLRESAIDFYIIGNDPDNFKMLPKDSLNSIMAKLVKYPFRCKPVYNEGVWGGFYTKKIRNLPDTMQNCAWVFDLIPLEVSIVVEAGIHLLEFPYFTFVQKEGEALMGAECVKKFEGYFPIRFNYDDSWHSSGNMSVQLHSGHRYNVENYAEHGRQDESYYIIATGHGAKTYLGFNEDADPDEFINEARKSEKDFIPVDYRKYINHIRSSPGIQVMIPAGTIHSSGRNQVVLEIGSLTVGSYTYKMYDYLREDLDGKPRPIHTYHGERNLRKERKTTWVRENLIQAPRLVRSGESWAEYILGEHDLLYFSLRRLEFEETIEDDTNGSFHVLSLVDGEKTVVKSLKNPELSYTQNYLDIIVVPANMGKYIIQNLGNQPVCIHKTMLKDGFAEEVIPDN
ncbi:class I mannose-6-phosphate isomerase [Mariniphaga sediminis]|uniref:class I mannose-6-phosphate isomerase n=1 Tax=Mariniphaga sediminis TaxID=1628158 RepID=UPI003562A928